MKYKYRIVLNGDNKYSVEYCFPRKIKWLEKWGVVSYGHHSELIAIDIAINLIKDDRRVELSKIKTIIKEVTLEDEPK